MSIRRGIRRSRSGEDGSGMDMSALTSLIEERIQAAVAPFASAVAELTQEVRKRSVSQQQRINGSEEGDDSRRAEEKCMPNRAADDLSWIEGSDTSS
ncbi:hypothetical protein TTRE_0000797601 [Trichuris trichiura]|uniref:Uncharacterized protein n=1 Tax=Trichuris trichiura TaxID=36087 RepID=A0A077ZJ57_TRITR|nr:hypothetical protein TTRE_0000797601 [Trichuris trichiura]